jgi:hypothetical protein
MKSNKLNLNKTLTVFVLLLLVAVTGRAQVDQESKKVMPVQITLISPLGTNGMASLETINNASLNILAGVSGGVKGAEIGGLANYAAGDITGVQLGGLVNASTGRLKGSQIAGLANYNHQATVGVQLGGILNINNAEITGTQVGGIANYNRQQLKGVQVGGITNITVGDVKGLQLSGIANIATGRASGAQLSLFNYSKVFKGFQLGLINIVDSMESGAALGLFTFVRNGYHKFEVEANETFFANATFKSGVNSLYTIYTVSYGRKNNTDYWAPGLGLGFLTSVGSKFDINVDLVAKQVNEGEWWTEELNMINTLSVNLAYKFKDNFSAFIGPAINVSVSGRKDEEGNLIGNSLVPEWAFYDQVHSGKRVQMYLGLRGGIRF